MEQNLKQQDSKYRSYVLTANQKAFMLEKVCEDEAKVRKAAYKDQLLH